MKKLTFLMFMLITAFLFSCKSEYPCTVGDSNISGAVCNDGTTSNATGQGACSHHGGVNYWLCCCE